MRAHVLGLEVVLPDGGRVDRLGRVPKDGTGYDLVGLVTGSEGTLGMVTTARLRLSRRPGARATALVALASVADAVALARTALAADGARESCELVEAEGVELVAEMAATHPPLAGRAMLLLECASDGAPEVELRQMLSGHAAVRGILVATEPHARHELWQWRERVPAAVSAAGIAHKLDVGVALSDVPVLLDGARSAVARLAPDARLVAFGHLGEGNLHLNVLGLAPDDERVDAALLGLVADLGGSIAAKHGVGRAKARYVCLGRSAADLGAMAAVKRALDPGLVANPGVLFAPGSLTTAGSASRRDEGGARW
jgi:FAD/FMN-containing dehydrogenase